MIHLNLSGFTPEEVYELILVGLTARKAHIDSEIEGLHRATKPGYRRNVEKREAAKNSNRELKTFRTVQARLKREKRTLKRTMSKEGRARIVAAQKKRWANAKKAKKQPEKKPTKPAKRKA